MERETNRPGERYSFDVTRSEIYFYHLSKYENLMEKYDIDFPTLKSILKERGERA